MKIIIELKETNIRYPRLLKKLDDRPKTIYALGNIGNLNNKCIAIIGSRECTSYGKKNGTADSLLLCKKGDM